MKKHREDLAIQVSEADSESDDSQMATSPCCKSPEPTTSDSSSESKSVVNTTTDLESQTNMCEENSEELTSALLKPAMLAAT